MWDAKKNRHLAVSVRWANSARRTKPKRAAKFEQGSLRFSEWSKTHEVPLGGWTCGLHGSAQPSKLKAESEAYEAVFAAWFPESSRQDEKHSIFTWNPVATFGRFLTVPSPDCRTSDKLTC